MRIALLNQFFPPDIAPTGRLTSDVAEHLSTLGHQVTVVAGNNGYATHVDDDSPSATVDQQSTPGVVRVRSPGIFKRGILRRLTEYASYYLGATWKLMRLPKQDVVICLTTPPWLVTAALAAGRLKGSKVVLWSMDLYPEVLEAAGMIRHNGIASRFFQWINRRIYKRLAHTICLDGAMRELIDQRYSPSSASLPMTVIPNWETDSRQQQPGEVLPEQLAQLCSAPDEFTVLYLGNTGVGHEFETIIDVAEQVRDDAITFLFVGGGKRQQELQAAVRERNLSNVHFHDYIPTAVLPTVLAAADASLITLRAASRGVMSPSKIYTYLAAGLPVLYVGPTETNVDEAIVEFKCGLSFRNGAVPEISRSLIELRDDQDQQRHFSTNASSAFKNAYCADKIMPQFEKLLADLQQGKDAASADHRADGELRPTSRAA